MRKTTAIIVSLFAVFVFVALLALPTRAEDQEKDRTSSSVHQEIESTGNVKVDIDQTVEEGGQMVGSMEDLDNSTDSAKRFENIKTRIENIQSRLTEENQERVRTMLEEQSQIRERITTALQNIEGRPAYLRFLIGPDYKNIGEARSQIVRLEAQIKELSHVKETLTSQEDKDAVQAAIDDLQTQLDETKTNLEQKTQGFSLFGWLVRLFQKTSN